MIKLPSLVTVYHGRYVYHDEAPAEYVDSGALGRAAKRAKDFAARCTSDEKLRKKHEALSKELEAGATAAAPAPVQKEKGKGK